MRVIPLPYRVLALLLLALACIGFGYVQGVTRESDRRDAQELHSIRAGVAAADKESTRREAVGAAREVVREKIRVVYRTIKEKVNVYIDTHANVDCGLDADGLRLWNAANAGAAAPVPGEPDYSLPGAAARQVGQLGGLAGQPHRGDGAGGAMPGPAEQAGGVRSPSPQPSPVNGRGGKRE